MPAKGGDSRTAGVTSCESFFGPHYLQNSRAPHSLYSFIAIWQRTYSLALGFLDLWAFFCGVTIKQVNRLNFSINSCSTIPFQAAGFNPNSTMKCKTVYPEICFLQAPRVISLQGWFEHNVLAGAVSAHFVATMLKPTKATGPSARRRRACLHGAYFICYSQWPACRKRSIAVAMRTQPWGVGALRPQGPGMVRAIGREGSHHNTATTSSPEQAKRALTIAITIIDRALSPRASRACS